MKFIFTLFIFINITLSKGNKYFKPETQKPLVGGLGDCD